MLKEWYIKFSFFNDYNYILFKRLIDDKNHKSQLKKKRKIPARSRFYQSYW